MGFGKFLMSLTKPELDDLKEKCNLTEDEEKIFDALARGKSRVYIAENLAMSCSTVTYKTNHILQKVKKLNNF